MCCCCDHCQTSLTATCAGLAFTATSDPSGMETRATRQGNDYVITGSKIWITNGGVADTIVVFAKTDPKAGARGVSAFVIDDARELEGLRATTIHGKLGIRGSN